MSTATIGQAYNYTVVRQFVIATLTYSFDDPQVARRVERATGKQINAVAPEEAKPGWINLDL